MVNEIDDLVFKALVTAWAGALLGSNCLNTTTGPAGPVVGQCSILLGISSSLFFTYQLF